MNVATKGITKLILKAADKARRETRDEPDPKFAGAVEWPMECTVGPGLEGAVACESAVGYVNGAKGKLSYRGYDIFDLCAHGSFEEVSFLLLHGDLPNAADLADYRARLVSHRRLPEVMRLLMSFPVERMNAMAALRLGTNLMRQKQTYVDSAESQATTQAIGADEDTDPSETYRAGKTKATFEFRRKAHRPPRDVDASLTGSEDISSCYRLIAGVPTIAAGIMRLRAGYLPLEPDLRLSHAANLLYSGSTIAHVVCTYNYRNIPLGIWSSWHIWDDASMGGRGKMMPGVKRKFPVGMIQPYFKNQRMLNNRALVCDTFTKGVTYDGLNRYARDVVDPEYANSNWRYSEPYEDGRLLAGYGFQHHRDGYNVLYGDGHAKWFGDPQKTIIWHLQGEGSNRSICGTWYPGVLACNYFFGHDFHGSTKITDTSRQARIGNAIWHEMDVAADIDVDSD